MDDTINMTNEDLLLEIDCRIEGCNLPDCNICPKTIAVMKKIANRMGVKDFTPSLEKRKRRCEKCSAKR